MTTKTILTTLILTAASLPAQPFPVNPIQIPTGLVGSRVLRVASMGDSFAAGDGSPNLSGDKRNTPPSRLPQPR